MKKLNNSLFKKFEPNKISNLAKIIGGWSADTTYGDGYCDCFISACDNPCATNEGYLYNHQTGEKMHGDLYDSDCDEIYSPGTNNQKQIV